MMGRRRPKVPRKAGYSCEMRTVFAAFLVAKITLLGNSTLAGEFAAADSDSPNYYKMSFSGAVEPGDVYKLQSHLAAIPAAVRNKITRKKVYLDSPGGDLEVGIELGRFFRKFQIRTEVARGAKCESACALAFLGGTTEGSGIAQRTKSSAAVLGFHAYRLDGDANSYDREFVARAILKSQHTMLDLVKYFLEVDGDPQILDRLATTPPDKMYYLSDSEALSYCIFVDKEQPDGTKVLSNPYDLRYSEPASPKTGSWQQSRCKYP